MAKNACLLFSAALFLALCLPAHGWEGRVLSAHDGDTLTVAVEGSTDAPMVIRLWGIDAPEKGQEGGEGALAFLRSMLPEGAALRLVTMQMTDRYGRQVCLAHAGGRCVNAEMVRAGWAWVAEKYCRGKMRKVWDRLQREARRQGRGIWSGGAQPVPPWEWRKGRKDEE